MVDLAAETLTTRDRRRVNGRRDRGYATLQASNHRVQKFKVAGETAQGIQGGLHVLQGASLFWVSGVVMGLVEGVFREIVNIKI